MTPKELKQAVEEFKEIYREEFDVEISDEAATAQVQDLLELFDCLTGGEILQ